MDRREDWSYQDLEVIKRFWNKVAIADSGECWNWKNGTQKGYGAFWDGQNEIRAHRYSYELAYGEIPNGMCVLHHCDNPKCVNPKHLFLGTLKDNSQDMARKGRASRGEVKGEYNGRSKLKELEILEMRRLYNAGIKNKTFLGKMFRIGRSQTGRILAGTSWAQETT